MAKPSIDEILVKKPKARLRIYAYSIEDGAHVGMLKIGQTTRNVKSRVEEQLKTALIKSYTIHLDESAEREDAGTFTDHEVRARLNAKGFPKVDLEWVSCRPTDVQTVIIELRTGKKLSGARHLTFPMRPEQADAVEEPGRVVRLEAARFDL